MSAYYNEHDPFAAQWLRNLIAKGLIAPGDVDERDIQKVSPDDVRGYRQVHFFAGIGGWSYALRLAGWDDGRVVWTGSCPCQPFSSAGKRKGEADERHLWPEMLRLIRECSPPVCFGEQVASDDGCRWLAGVFADLEALEYRVAGADLCAASVGAPHIRQRIWWVADATVGGRGSAGYTKGISRRRCDSRGLGHTDTRRQQECQKLHGEPLEHSAHGSSRGIDTCGSGDGAGRLGIAGSDGPQGQLAAWPTPWPTERASAVDCRDGKARRIEPGLSPLAHGVPARVGRLRGYGNAIVPHVAAAFIRAFQEAA